MRAILTYHSIDASGAPTSIAPEVFAAHLSWFASGQVPVVSLAELVRADRSGNAVAITFDDAFESAGSLAVPRLAALGVPVSIFVPSGHVGGRARWASARTGEMPGGPIMSWARLAELVAAGVEIGAHTRTHPRLTECSDDQLESELEGAREDIAAHLGTSPVSLAYPYGVHDARVRAAAAARYRYAVTTELRCVDADARPEALPRLDAWYFRHPDCFAQWGSTAFLARLAVRRVARSLRAVLS